MDQLFSQFKEHVKQKWPSGFVEVVDPASPNQCFDLVVAWTDFLKLPRSLPFRYAYQIYTNYGPEQAKYYDKIDNGPMDKIQVGDIPVWAYNYNYLGGHTGIGTGEGVVNGNKNDWFNAYVQNDPFGTRSIIRRYPYDKVLGWLRPKISQPPLSNEELVKKTIEILKSGDNSFDKEFKLKQLYRL